MARLGRLVTVLAAIVAVAPACVRRPSGPRSAGERIYRDRCGRCHDLVPPHAYSSRQWPGVLSRMAREAELNDGEVRQILQWLHEHNREDGS